MSKPRRPARSRGGSGAPRRGSSSGGSAKGTGKGGEAARSGPRPPKRAPSKTASRGASKRRSGVGGEQVEGRQAVRELLLAGRRKVREVWVLADVEPAPILDDIRELATAERVPVREVGRGKFFAEARCEAPQGVLAKAAELPEVSLDDLATTAADGRPPFLVALDGVTDPGNLGALLRSAASAGVTGIVLPRHRAVHVTPTVTKAAAGAVEHLPFCVVGGLPAALGDLRKQEVWVVGLDSEGPTSLWDLPAAAEGPVALVLGAEGAGLGRLVGQRCDSIVRIPLAGPLGSLNVATAGALACFEVARTRLRSGGVPED